jgi:excisionase family DNA binding protein
MSRRAEPRIKDLATHSRRNVSLRVAADYLGIDRRTLNNYLDAGLLAFLQFGKRRKIAIEELAAFEQRQTRRHAS